MAVCRVPRFPKSWSFALYCSTASRDAGAVDEDVASAVTRGTSSGGGDLVDLAIKARNDHP